MSLIDQGLQDEKNLTLRKSTDLIKVWTNSNGSALNASLPSIKVEHTFPGIDDPSLILKAINEERGSWDQSMDVVEELK